MSSEMVEAEVIASGISYFSSSPVLDANGNPRKSSRGEDLYATSRREALMGDVVEMSQFEFDRLAADQMVQVPGSAPLPNRAPPAATPFSVPLPGQETWAGPVMGDPSPVGGLADNELHRRSDALTPEEARALEEEAIANGGAEARGNEDAFLAWDEDTNADDVKAFVDANGLNAQQTLALADSKEHAEVVLEAELARDNPRSTVVTPLEKQTEE